MNKIRTLVLLLAIGFLSCKNSEKEVDKLEIAKQYYKILENSDDSEITSLLTDNLLTKETEYDYEQTFSVAEYVEWVKWDAVFDPAYEILRIEQEGEVVNATVSKIDKRIRFLHREPIVTNQTLRFDGNKIVSIETTKYVVFNDSIFVANRSAFLNFIDKNHSDLNGFIHDQTEAGGRNYLKAIEFYNKGK